MSLRWPDLELLRQGHGDLIALSPLSRTHARTQMIEALRRLDPAFAHLDDNGPDVALIEALAACVEIMGFYHDRFLTESKLGAAQLLDDVGKIVALIGYRPLPAVAATAFQYFEALTAGSVLGGTRVAAKLGSPPATIAFETALTIDVSPALNQMALSPLITAAPGAIRAVVSLLVPGAAAASLSGVTAQIARLQQTAGPVLPSDDFRPDTLAMVADAQGLELVAVADSRSRGVAFDRGLSRNFAKDSALISRTTVVRNLRGYRALADDLIAFEVSAAPILHLPSVGAPELLTSTLEIFVLRPGDEALDPSEWDPALRYDEVPDFSASEVSDLHYRTFVDDRLHTWIELRLQVGARPLLDAAALTRVHARFVPAVGTMLGADEIALCQATPDGPTPILPLTDVTLGLDHAYFASSLILPPIANARLAASATWALVDRALGLGEGDAILIQDGSGQRWVRTLDARPAAASARLLRWADPIDRALDPATTKIDSLIDAARGDAFPTWSELYAQLQPIGPAEPAHDLPIVALTAGVTIVRRRVIAAGTTFLVLADASHIAVGDYILLGSRLTEAFRAPLPFRDWRWAPGAPAFDPSTPWLDAEIVRTIELRGNVVRLATPVSQDYFVHHPSNDPAIALSEIIVLPGVVSVASGDGLIQRVELSTDTVFQGRDQQLHDTGYVVATLVHAVDAAVLRAPVTPRSPPALPVPVAVPAQVSRSRARVAPPTPGAPAAPAAKDLWADLFVAVAGVVELQTDAIWSFQITIQADDLRAAGSDIARLEDGTGAALTDDVIGAAIADGAPIALGSAAAAATIAKDRAVIAVLAKPPVWHQVSDGSPPARDQFVVREQVSLDVMPASPADAATAALFATGTLVVRDTLLDQDVALAFTWDASAGAPHLHQSALSVSDPFDALLVSTVGVDLSAAGAARHGADWLVPAARFTPAFAQLPAGILVAATGEHTIAVDRPFRPLADQGLLLSDVTVDSLTDPLAGVSEVWAVAADVVQLAPGAAEARWVYAPTAGPPLPAGAIRLALVGARKVIVRAQTASDQRSAIIGADDSAHAGDLGFALDALYALAGAPVEPAQITASAIWAWPNVDPPLADLPEPAHSLLVAVLPPRRPGELHAVAWPRDFVWWEPERRTLRLPIEPLAASPDVRPSDVVRLLQVLAPPIDHRQLVITYDRTTDRSLITLAVPAGWPGRERAPAPVVIASLADTGVAHAAHSELRDLAAPVEVFTGPDGRVRWTLCVTGDVQKRWRAISVVVRDWSAPGQRGLAVQPLWQVAAPAAWRAHAAGPLPQPVTLIVTPRDGSDVLTLAAMPRLAGSQLELAPLGRVDAFPATADVAHVDLAAYTALATPDAPLALRGTTVLDLAAGTPGTDRAVTAIVFVNDQIWQPIAVTAITAITDSQRYELDRAYLSLFPEGIAVHQQIRLCYASSPLVPGAAPTARTLRLRIAALAQPNASAATAAVFHGRAGDLALAQRVVLDTIAPPRVEAGALVVELALEAAGLAAIYNAQGVKQPRLELAQRWRALPAAAVVRQPLRVELGAAPPYALAAGDPLLLGFPGQPDPVRAAVHSCTSDGVLEIETAATLAPNTITLYGLRTQVASDDYAATLDLAPSSAQPPWLLSFDRDIAPASLRDTLLPYTALAPAPGTQVPPRLRFQFDRGDKRREIFARAGQPLYLFTNERGELRDDFYTASDDRIAKDLGPAPIVNFLTAPDGTSIDQLILTTTAWAGQQLDAPRPVVFAAIDWQPDRDAPGELPPAQWPELAIAAAKQRRLSAGVVLQSVRFNTGNFISLGLSGSGQGTSAINPASIIANAIRVSAQPLDRDGKPTGRARQVSFVSLDDLAALNGKLAGPSGTGGGLHGVTYDLARLSGALSNTDDKYVFSASFSAAGVCTLHFLIIDDLLIGSVEVEIEAQYEVSPGRAAGNGLADPIYPLEVAVTPLDPTSRLALLAPTALKPGALVFVRMPGMPDLQWAQVTRVVGPLVEVDPPLAVAQGAASVEPIQVTTLGRLEGAAGLDTDYYATVAKAKLAPPGALSLPLHDRLPLDVVAGAPLLAALVPGDTVLIYDDRQRRAWAERRQGGTTDGQPSAADWRQWPDFQHEAVVKRVDAETGLVVLSTPLPDRFQIAWIYDAAAARLTASDDDVGALRVLLHYRAAVHGARSLTVLGSGDATRKFPRYLSTLDPRTGSAVIGLAGAGVMTGNLEVLAFDPVKAQWSRWLRFADLARAGKRDLAYELGFRPGELSGQVPVSVTFGDGVTGALLPTGGNNLFLRATQIAAPSPWLAQRQPVRIASRDGVQVVVESSAPAELTGSSSLGAAQWQSTLGITVTRAGLTSDLREITADAAAHGARGFVVTSTPALPPGMVAIALHTPDDLTGAQLTAWQAPGARQWALDDAFYTTLTTPDLTASPGAVVLPLVSTTGLRAGSLLALYPDRDSAPAVVRLASIDPPTWSAVLEQPLARTYDLARSFIRGNVVAIVQGAVDRTTIGSSDGTTPSLRLVLPSRALLYVTVPGDLPVPDLHIEVAGQAWDRVLDFTGLAATSRVWRLDTEPDGSLFVVFGDGKQGAIPPAGRDHIDAIMRTGSGAAGNVAAGAINQMVTGNLAIKSTRNVTAAAGGSAGDDPAAAREKASAFVLPSDRVVAADDCVRVAIGESGVISAALDPTAPAGTISLVVAMEDRRAPTAEDLAAVHDRVAGAMPLTARVRLAVTPAIQQAVHLVVELGLTDDAVVGVVFAAVSAALGSGPAGLFAAAQWDIGEPLRLGALYDALFQIAGIAHARVVWMASTPLPEGEAPPASAPDVFDPGATGVVRCDNDAAGDPFGRFGTFRLEQVEGV